MAFLGSPAPPPLRVPARRPRPLAGTPRWSTTCRAVLEQTVALPLGKFRLCIPLRTKVTTNETGASCDQRNDDRHKCVAPIHQTDRRRGGSLRPTQDVSARATNQAHMGGVAACLRAISIWRMDLNRDHLIAIDVSQRALNRPGRSQRVCKSDQQDPWGDPVLFGHEVSCSGVR